MKIHQDEEELDWQGGDCWFCGRRPPVHGKSYFVKMKKFTDAPGGGVRILRSSVAVPRCAECEAGHLRVSDVMFKGVLGGGLAVFLVVVVWDPFEMSGGLQAFLVLVGFLLGGLFFGSNAKLPQGQKSVSTAEVYMAVEEMKRGGWIKDDQP